MDCLRFQSLMGIQADVTEKKLTPVSAVSIPNRDLTILQAFSNSLYSLQIWARGRKPTRAASEISIPNRDFESLILLKAMPILAYNNFTPRCYKSCYCLPMLILINPMLALTRWCEPSSAETETRCDRCLHPSDANLPLLGKKPLFNKTEWRFRYMGKFKQLELFDLQPYTSEQLTAIDGEVERFEKIRQGVEYEQLELDLFPQPFYETFIELVRLAA